jgi:hypothetical protein
VAAGAGVGFASDRVIGGDKAVERSSGLAILATGGCLPE